MATSKKTLIFIYLSTFFVTSIISQHVYRQYHTEEYMEVYEMNNPEYFDERKKIEQHFFNFRSGPSIKPIEINVIFHVIYQEEIERLDSSVIFKQLERSNNHFGPNTYNPEHVNDPQNIYEEYFCPNTFIQFKLIDQSCLDSAGVNAKPINYLSTQKENWTIDNNMKYKESGGISAVLPSQILNVWICNLDETNFEFAGFAQLPGGKFETDGIVIDYQFISDHLNTHAQYNEGNSLTHLIANYLNVLNLWWGNCADDQVSDTPVHNSPNFGCPIYAHVSTCQGILIPEMTMNFMDNTDDYCQYMFTYGQAVRMHATLDEGSFRSGIVNLEKCEMEEFGDNEPPPEFNALIYPNPTDQTIKIYFEHSTPSVHLNIFDPTGRLVYNSEIETNIQNEIDLGEYLISGLYIVNLQGEDFCFSKKITIFK